MSIESNQHPESFSGDLTQFSFHKIERQTKSVLKDILNQFFSSSVTSYKIAVPEIIILQNTDSETKLNIERDFPFYERKMPLIAISSRNKRERKPFLGADDFIYQDALESTDGSIQSFYNMYANMYDVPVDLIIAAMSPDIRSQISELVALCFSHYYRWPYLYKGDSEEMFNIIPTTTPVEITGENVVTDISTQTLIYTCTVRLNSFVEYIFPDIGDNWNILVTEGFNYMDRRTSTGNETLYVPIYVYGSMGEITSTGYYTSTGYNGNDIRWWADYYTVEEEEDVRNPLESYD